MRRIVLTCGLVCGAILSVMLLLTIPFVDRIGYDKGAIVGYAGMVLAFLMIWFGVRAYRDCVARGSVSFRQAFTVGILIRAIGTVCYVATWEVVYFNFMPDFMDDYGAEVLQEAKQSGATEAELAEQARALAAIQEEYRKPLANIAYTLLEPLPVGVPFVLLTPW